MKAVMIHMKLPDDLAEKALELAGNRTMKDFILDALREKCFPRFDVEALPSEMVEVSNSDRFSYPTYGSIPSERKDA
jgi:hypothetical protein